MKEWSKSYLKSTFLQVELPVIVDPVPHACCGGVQRLAAVLTRRAFKGAVGRSGLWLRVSGFGRMKFGGYSN